MADSTDTLVSEGEDDGPDHSNVKSIGKADDILSCISEGFTESKADQILRLLRDQEDLNERLNDCDIKNTESDSEVDSDTLSDTSVKETEKRLAARLSLHRQIGGRSKTSMGFYNDADRLRYSSDEDDLTMDQDRPINTRINRPKSSYVRRRTDLNGDSTDENMPDDLANQRRCRSSRPKSRCGNREQVQSRAILKETSYNTQAPPASPNTDLVDQGQYDRYAHVRTPVPAQQHPGVQRQRTRIRTFCENPAAEPQPKPQSNLQRQRTVQDISKTQTYSSDEARDEFHSSPRQRHRRQQFRHARANRPGSENVYLVRQRTESNMLKARANCVRPKSDKTLIQQSKQNKMISIDTNPLQAAQNGGYQPVQSSLQTSHPQQRYQAYGSPQQRPVSRRSHARQDISINPRGPGVIPGRPQPIGVMKLPPLDPAVAKRAERIVLAAHETCV